MGDPTGEAEVGGLTRRHGVALVLLSLVVPVYVGGTAAVNAGTDVGTVEQGFGAETAVTTQGLISERDDRNARGRVMLYGVNGSERWQYSYRGSFFDATRLDNGTVLVAFGIRVTDCAPYDPPCDRTGVRIIDPDPQPHVVWEYSWPVRMANNAEVHDVEYLGEDRVLVADMEAEQLFALNMSTRERGWTWNASAFYTPPDDPTTRDWLHINDVDQIAPGRYLVSVRNANQLLIVEPQHGTTDRDAVREVINRDRTDTNDRSCHSSGALVPDRNGDVRCGDPAVLHRQHNPQWLGNGTVLVADSHNNRVVELHRDDDGRWRVAWATHRAGQIPFEWPRDADRRPDGTTLITDSGQNRIVLVDEDGEIERASSVPLMPYDADLPGGESVTGPPVGTLDGNPNVDPPSDRYPGLTTLLFSLQHVLALPWWFDELHLAGLIASAVVAIFGVGVTVAGGKKTDEREDAVAGSRTESTEQPETGDGGER